MKRNGVCNMLWAPPKEIAKQIRFKDKTVYYVGELTEKQKAIFEEFKKKYEEGCKGRRFD